MYSEIGHTTCSRAKSEELSECLARDSEAWRHEQNMESWLEIWFSKLKNNNNKKFQIFVQNSLFSFFFVNHFQIFSDFLVWFDWFWDIYEINFRWRSEVSWNTCIKVTFIVWTEKRRKTKFYIAVWCFKSALLTFFYWCEVGYRCVKEVETKEVFSNILSDIFFGYFSHWVMHSNHSAWFVIIGGAMGGAKAICCGLWGCCVVPSAMDFSKLRIRILFCWSSLTTIPRIKSGNAKLKVCVKQQNGPNRRPTNQWTVFTHSKIKGTL